MNENTTKLIEQLAEKMGTTSQYLWSILIKQAPVDATITLIQILISIAFALILYKIHKKLSKSDKDGYNRYDDNEFTVIIMAVALCSVIILLIASFCCIGDVINGYFNPEYWALDKVLHSIKS